MGLGQWPMSRPGIGVFTADWTEARWSGRWSKEWGSAML